MTSTSGRLTIRFAAISGVLLAVFGAGLYTLVRQDLERRLDRDLAVVSALFQERFLVEMQGRSTLAPDDVDDLDRLLQTAGAEAEVRGPDGSRLYRSRGFDEAASGVRRVEARLSAAPGQELRVRVSLSDAAVEGPLRQLRTYVAFFTPVGLVLASIVGYVFSRSTLSPVEELRRHAERITRAHLSERVPLPPGGELRDLACTFNEMLDRIEQGVEDLRHMAADAAHELRTPLANLRAEVESAIQEGRTPEERRRALASVGEEVGRMSQIVSDLYTLAQLDSRRHVLERRPVELRPLLEEARETWEPLARERGIEMRLEGGDASVQGDVSALSRIFMNLVENAVKYNRDGGRIRLSIERRNGSARVDVADTGPGIPAEHLPKLFRRFYRADPARSRETGGTGLGLALVKSYVEALSGTIAVRSSAQEGTTFTLEFPISGAGGPGSAVDGRPG
ncbi:MAG TPA: ATP-binding protein [Planctomycetota bacterium]|nr:ATP-binding protein [Planctomycetota bacterium]